MSQRLLRFNEPHDGPRARVLITFKSPSAPTNTDTIAVVLLNYVREKDTQAFLDAMPDINGAFTNTKIEDKRVLELALPQAHRFKIEASVEVGPPLSSFTLASDGNRLVIPLEDIKESKGLHTLGLVITGKQYLKQPICKMELMAKDTPTPFVSDAYGDSYNDSFFKEPRVIDAEPSTVFAAIDDIVAIAKRLFKQNDLEAATLKFKKAVHYTQSYFPDDLAKKDSDCLYLAQIQSLLNLALCYIKLDCPAEAVECCTIILDTPYTENVPILQAKTLFRLGLAYIGLNDEEKALEYLQESYSLHKDPGTHNAMERCYAMRRSRKQRHQRSMQRAFS